MNGKITVIKFGIKIQIVIKYLKLQYAKSLLL